ncbi:sulfotransferase [Roseobacter sp.]|uniref:sulfotransferase family protein n=1 Tax=Roseobacter sp. TaxID=1907202 RepID=UPI003298A2AF
MTALVLDAPNGPTPPAARKDLCPNLFVIGASKSGSSALHAYLKPHPDIQMSTEKEPCFFVDQPELEAAWPIMARQACSHDWDAYLDLWPGGDTARYRGEGSVFYSQSPHRSGVAARIAAACPDARIIYTVREPVRRAIGHYWQRHKEFAEPLPLSRAVRENALYRDTSDYALQLSEYLAHFDQSQIHVVVAEDMRRDRRNVLAGVFDWLDLAPYAHADTELTDRHTSAPTSRKERFPFVRALRDSSSWAKTRQYLPKSLVAAARSAATVKFDKSDIDEQDARDWLETYLNPRVEAFESLIGRKIEAWRVGG